MSLLTSAAGILSLLEESELNIQSLAISQLLVVVDNFWAEISDFVPKLEALYEDEKFIDRLNVALLLSKVYYHLGEYKEAVNYALLAGEKFPLFSESEFVETITSKCIDTYIQLKEKEKNPLLEATVAKIFQKSVASAEWKQAIGLALETERIDWLEMILASSTDQSLLVYTKDLVFDSHCLEFRNKAISLLVKLYLKQQKPDFLSVCECCIYLDDIKTVHEILHKLLSSGQQILAYQIGFDLYDNANQHFCTRVHDLFAQESSNESQKLRSILSGKMTSSLNLAFLSLNNHSDMQILTHVKEALNVKNSLHHSSVSFSNALMNAGTTNDEFLRKNMEWLSYASNWGKFTAAAALGLIHQGHVDQGEQVLKPYLPQDGVSSSPYSEGGALFALGLINCNHGSNVVAYLKNILSTSQNETIQHGAALGLGIAAMGTEDSTLMEILKTILYSDSAVAGEAAGISMGLIMAGCGPSYVDEILQYAHETQHEKTIRGLAVGIALMMYGLQDKADMVIESLLTDKDPILRYGGAFCIGLAYAGTGDNASLRKLLHIAVSDTTDDVRRAAVICIGFVMFNQPKMIPKMVELLTQSYNPHVRYGSSLALGIACAASGNEEALKLIEPMKSDLTDFVRQGAMIAESMILIQENSARATQAKESFEKIACHKHEDSMARFGAILSLGIIDAAGRNATISLSTSSGQKSMLSIIGMALFCQFWYWHPMVLFLGSSFKATGLICLDEELKVPNFEVTSNVPFPYPSPRITAVNVSPEKTATAILSTTARALARAKKQEKEKKGMEVEPVEAPKEAQPMQIDEIKKDEAADQEAAKIVQNFQRIVPKQWDHVRFNERFVPLLSEYSLKEMKGGIMMVVDKQKGSPVEYVQLSKETDKKSDGAVAEVAPPQSFVFEE